MKNIICPGFIAGGIASGIKKNGKHDLGIIYTIKEASVAGVFTKNKVKAAPVILDMQRIPSGICKAVVVNSGNANCCTGEKGFKDAVKMSQAAASMLDISDDMVLVSSTGVIGEPFPVEKIINAMPDLVKSSNVNGFYNFAKAIMTTDKVVKIVSKKETIDNKTFTITGVAKGSGMIRPDMATMLCFVCTDVKADSDMLKHSLLVANEKSFNVITVDGDTSTNDMVILMANGESGASISNASDKKKFQTVLDDVLLSLAKMVVKDGEGANKLVEVEVKNAVSDKQARQIADTVANSNLVKTAIFGEDANWGRILAAAGRAEALIEPYKTDIYFDNILMVKNGQGCGALAEEKVSRILKKTEYKIIIDLHMGQGSASYYTCDFSFEYIKINADYRS